MAKDPAFLFYSSDFLTGVLDLTMEERGQYITLLCIQHQKGPLNEKTIRLSVGSISDCVLSKFQKNEDGLFYQKRLCEEIEKREKFTESRRNNGSLGGRPSKNKKPNGKPNGKPNENHTEDENEDENINTDVVEIKKELAKNKNFKIPEFSEIVEHFKFRNSTEIEAAKFYNFYQSKNWMVGKSKMKDWRAAANGWVLRNKTDFKNGGQKLDRTDQNKMTTIAALHKLNQKIESNEV